MMAYSGILRWLMSEDIPYADKVRHIDDALRHMHKNYGGYGKSYSIGAIASFIGVKTSRLEGIEKSALNKVEKLLKEQTIYEYDCD